MQGVSCARAIARGEERGASLEGDGAGDGAVQDGEKKEASKHCPVRSHHIQPMQIKCGRIFHRKRSAA